jgi:hypothetical protein
LDLRAVERDMPQLHQPRASAELKHLDEEAAERFEMSLPEVRDRPVIGTLHARHRSEVEAFDRGARDPPRRIDALRVRVEEKRDHHRRVIGREASFLGVHVVDRRQIKRFAHELPNEVSRMIRRDEVRQRRRKQKRLFWNVLSE